MGIVPTNEHFLMYQKLIWQKVHNANLDYLISRDELFAYLCISYMKACRNFDESKNHKFTTFLDKVIVNDIRQLVRKMTNKTNSLYNNHLDLDKQISTNSTFKDILIDEKEDVADNYVNSKFSKDVIDYLKSIDDKNIINMLLKGYTQKQIAKTLNTPQSNVNKQIHKLYQKAREKFSL